MYFFILYFYIKILIPIRFVHILKDVFPYLFITVFILCITYVITISIENIYVRLFARIVLAIIFYVLFLKVVKAVMLDESLRFMKDIIKNKTTNNY